MSFNVTGKRRDRNPKTAIDRCTISALHVSRIKAWICSVEILPIVLLSNSILNWGKGVLPARNF
jgi:hypothetical protein